MPFKLVIAGSPWQYCPGLVALESKSPRMDILQSMNRFEPLRQEYLLLAIMLSALNLRTLPLTISES